MAKKEANIGGLVSLENVQLNWVRLSEPDENGKYSAHCSRISDEQAEQLVAIGLEPKHGDNRVDGDGNAKPTPEWAWYITPRTKFDFALVDGDGSDISGEDKVSLLEKIGDGTIANVEVKSGAYNTNGKRGVSCYLQAIQIIKLVQGSGGHSFKKVEGEEVYRHQAEAAF